MRVTELMTKLPSTCGPSTTVAQVAKAMVKCDCGAIPVIEAGRVVGIITDRDIVIRAVAAEKCPLELTAGELMSRPVATLLSDASVESALKVLEQNKVRRAPVVDMSGRLVGILSQADIARSTPLPQVGELLHDISQGFDIGHD